MRKKANKGFCEYLPGKDMSMGLARKILEGDIQAAARLLNCIEDEVQGTNEELKELYPYTGKAYVVGLTGSAGVGKSTLINVFIKDLRKKGLTVGVIVIDPTSPFTGGAILGDRLRMQGHSLDQEVFIRSVATRGWKGGLSKATIGMIHVMDALGKDIILVETVGTGQGEIEVSKISDACVIILSPGAGDEVQMMKAGILEVADIFVVNKADKEGAAEVKLKLEGMIYNRSLAASSTLSEWKPKVILTNALGDKGIEELTESVFEHRNFLTATGELEKRRQERARTELMDTIKNSVEKHIYQTTSKDAYLEELVNKVASREVDPYTAASKILRTFTPVVKN